MIDLNFEPAVVAPENALDDSIWLLFYQGRLLVSEHPDLPPLPERLPLWHDIDTRRAHYCGRWNGQHCFAMELEHPAEYPTGFYEQDLRALLARGEESLFAAASRAAQILTWHRNHRFCSRCGEPTRDHPHDRAKVCEGCGYTQYPRITPCVIVLIHDGDRCLLGRSPNFPEGLFSTFAGFMEAGENAEQAVIREVFEETGVKIKKLRYHGSQSWPFPHSIMLGFYAEYDEGELRIDHDEIIEAGWWHYDALPAIPPKGSISRTLIDHWVTSRRQQAGDND